MNNSIISKFGLTKYSETISYSFYKIYSYGSHGYTPVCLKIQDIITIQLIVESGHQCIRIRSNQISYILSKLPNVRTRSKCLKESRRWNYHELDKTIVCCLTRLTFQPISVSKCSSSIPTNWQNCLINENSSCEWWYGSTAPAPLEGNWELDGRGDPIIMELLSSWVKSSFFILAFHHFYGI